MYFKSEKEVGTGCPRAGQGLCFTHCEAAWVAGGQGPQRVEATSTCSLVTALTRQVTSTGGFCVLLPQDRMASLRSHAGHSVGEDDRDTTGCGHICFLSRQASAPPKGRDQRVLTGVARPRPPRQAPRAPQQLCATPQQTPWQRSLSGPREPGFGSSHDPAVRGGRHGR